MNAIGWALLWMSVPISLVASAALVLERIVSRRGPAAGSWASAASLLVIVVLTPLAVCGLPERWSWRIPSSVGRAESVSGTATGSGRVLSSATASWSAAVQESDSREGGRGLFGSRAWWRRFFDGDSTDMGPIRNWSSCLTLAWGGLVLSGAGWCLVRLVLGLWGVREARRRSAAIEDSGILALVASLRQALSIVREVEVRELASSGGSTAAAAGWLRPFVLLPRDWRGWSSLERRAVLAHELAHIARSDYAAGIVAQLGLALHFYHPLVHWMVARLRLQQELAADAIGATLAGGRHSYVIALSRMALRPEEKPLAWPARTFLASGGDLIRRIQMLRQKLQRQDRSLSGGSRVVLVIILIAAGVAAVGFRGVAPVRAGQTFIVTTAATESTGQRFDLSYISPDAVGVWAIRPAAIYRLPGVKSQFDRLNAELAKAQPQGLPRLESIEQAAVEFSVLPRDPSKKLPGRLVTGDWTVRSIEDFDWKDLMTRVLKTWGRKSEELVEAHVDDHVYYKTAELGIFGRGACLYFPDRRTVVCSFHEDGLRERIRRGASEQLEFVRGDDWRQVDRGLMAIAIDNRRNRWTLDVSKEYPEDLAIAPLLQNATRWVAGVDASDVLKIHAIATCPEEAKGAAVARIVREKTAMAQGVPDVVLDPGSTVGARAEKAPWHTVKELARVCRIRHEGAVVDLNAERKVEPDAIAALFMELVPF
jgi:beta-lactamase regulating signal transducer with metallopeptidase domain